MWNGYLEICNGGIGEVLIKYGRCGVCLVRGYRDVNVELSIGNI